MNGTVKGLWKHYYGLIRGANKASNRRDAYRKLFANELYMDNIKWLCKHYGLDYWKLVFSTHYAMIHGNRG